MPASRQRSRSPFMAWAVMAMMGIRGSGTSRSCPTGWPGRLETVHHRHLHVHEHEVVGDLLQGLDGLAAVGHGVGAEAQLLQDAQGHLLVGGVVFDQQDAHLAAPGLAEGVAGDERRLRRLARCSARCQDRGQAIVQLRLLDRLGQVGGEADGLEAAWRRRAGPGRSSSPGACRADFGSALIARPRDSPSISGICMSRDRRCGRVALGAGGAQQAQRLRRAPRPSAWRTLPGRQLFGQDQPVGGVVVDDQDAHAAEVRPGTRPRRARGGGCLPKTAVNQKVDPRPSSLSTPISPPISSARRLEMARPSPVPP